MYLSVQPPRAPRPAVLLQVLRFWDPEENVSPRGEKKCYILYDGMECYSREGEECDIS